MNYDDINKEIKYIEDNDLTKELSLCYIYLIERLHDKNNNEDYPSDEFYYPADY